MNPNVLRQLTDTRERAVAYSKAFPCIAVVYLFKPVGCDEFCGAALKLYVDEQPADVWDADGYIGESVMSFERKQ